MDISRRTALGALAATPLASASLTARPRTVLVADEEKTVADIVSRASEAVLNANVIKTTNVREAHHIIRAIRHDLAIIYWGLYQSPAPRRDEIGEAHLITSYFDDETSLGRPFLLKNYYAQLGNAPAFDYLKPRTLRPKPRIFGA